MRRSFTVLACCLFLTPSLRAQDSLLPDGSPLSGNGGLIIMRRGEKVAELITKDTNPDEVVSLIVGAETVRK